MKPILVNWFVSLALCFGPLLPSSSGGAANPISIVPQSMTFSGDVVTAANSVGYCPSGWLQGMPPGSIILGVDPQSCSPQDWNGATASADISLPAPYPATLYVIEIRWPDQAGKGLHSPVKNVQTSIFFDGKLLWSKRATRPGEQNSDYYAAQHEAIRLTVLVRQAATHTFEIAVPAQTAWDLSAITFTAFPAPTNLRGIGYSPYLDCQNPGGESQPSLAQVQADLEQLIHSTNAIRTYSATGINSQVPALANALNLPVFAGAWLDSTANDAVEMDALIRLAQTTNLAGVIVGNEYYLRHHTDSDLVFLHQMISQAKSAIPAGVPVATAEIDSLMFLWNGATPSINPAYRPILDDLDIILVHIYPFWNGLPIDGAADFTVQHYQAIRELIAREYPSQNKRVIIGETGWPSAGAALGQAVPSLDNQNRYIREFLSLAEMRQVDFFYFDTYDELWKIEEAGHVGQNWGYGYSDRSAKHAFWGVLIPSAELFPTKLFLPWITSLFTGQPALHSAEKRVLGPLKSRQSASVFSVYNEWPEETGHFVPSGWMGDISQASMYECDRSDPHGGEMAVRASFSPYGEKGWAGVYWQYPENNWGSLPQGIDLSSMNKLTFWAKGAQGGEKIKFFVGGIGLETDPYPDSLRPEISTGYIQLSSTWQQFSINLNGSDLSHVIGGFGWATDRCANPQGATFFLDDIQFEFDETLPFPPFPHGATFPVYSDAAAADNHFAPAGWIGDAIIPGRVSLTECWAESPHQGSTSIRIEYSQNILGWAGMYWLSPAENWGDRPGGIDLAGAKRVTFWARSDTPGAQVKFLVGGVGYTLDASGNSVCASPLHVYPDSLCPAIAQIETLNETWTKYTINLSTTPAPNLTHLVGGFGWVAQTPLVFYLDDIVYEFE